MQIAPEPVFSPEAIERHEAETPFFLISKQKIRDKIEMFKKYFPGAGIHFAMKANAEREVLQTILDAGGSFEVASAYELDMLKEIDVPADRIIYGTSVKPASHIKAFADYGVDRFAFDSFSELEKIASIAPNARVYVRISVNDTGSVFKFSEKFGTAKENALPMLKRARELGLHPYGLSFNVGSQASNPRAWGSALESLLPVIEKMKDEGIELEIIDIGGGYPCNSYLSSEKDCNLEEIAYHLNIQYEKLSYKPTFILEPGRAVIAEAAIMVTQIIAKIERNEHTWLFIDGGVYSGLFETMAYQGSTRYRITSLRTSFDSGESLFAIAGPTGDSPDVVTREALLPKDIDVGDKIVIHDVGAYSLVATCLFNGFPKPPVYYV